MRKHKALAAFLFDRILEEEAEACMLGDTLKGGLGVLDARARRLKVVVAEAWPPIGTIFLQKWARTYSWHPDYRGMAK